MTTPSVVLNSGGLRKEQRKYMQNSGHLRLCQQPRLGPKCLSGTVENTQGKGSVIDNFYFVHKLE
jgi:hypothetical protein